MAFTLYRWMEDIDGLHCCLASLLVAKHQVNPVMQVMGHQRGLQSCSMHQHKPDHEITIYNSIMTSTWAVRIFYVYYH